MIKFNNFLFALTFFLIANIVLAQPKYVKDANNAFRDLKYFDASNKCSAAFIKLGTKGDIKFKGEMAYKAAESFRLTDRITQAREWYEKAIELKYFEVVPEIYLNHGEVLRMLAENEKAIKSYQQYQKINPKDTRTQTLIEICEQNEKFNLIKTKHVITHEAGLSKKEMDMAPVFADKGKTLIIFGSSRKGSVGDKPDPITGESYMDLWMSTKDKKDNWLEPVPLDKGLKLNTGNSEGTICFDKEFKSAFITRCPNAKKQNLGCEIMVAEMSGLKYDKGGAKWKDLDTLPLKSKSKGLNLADSVSVGHPCVTSDEKLLIFASDATEINGIKSLGGRDLWSVELVYNKKDKIAKYGIKPETLKNLGPNVNTPANELFPTLGSKGELFFASDGHPGFGGLDIFVIAADDKAANSWPGKAENVGSPINSSSNDYAIYDNNRAEGYFTSERKGPNGEHSPDIYSYKLPEIIFDLNVIVYERTKEKKKIDGALVVLTEVGSSEMKEELTTNSKGRVSWEKKGEKRIIIGNKTYKITASKDGYVNDVRGTTITTVGLTNSKSFAIEISLLPMRDIELNEVQYVKSQWVFIKDSTCQSMDSIAAVKKELDAFPNVVIKIISHTDARDTPERNQTLSENRARAYYSALVDMGVDPRRIIPEGRGEKEPRKYKGPETNNVEVLLTEEYINQFKTSDPKKYELLHQRNRRTTAEVVRQDFNPETDTLPIEEAKKKYNYKNYLKY